MLLEELLRQMQTGQIAIPGGSLPQARMSAGAMPAAPNPNPQPVKRFPSPENVSSPAQSSFAPNPLASMARGYSSGGLIGAIGNMMEEPQLMARAQQAEAKKTAADTAQKNATLGYLKRRHGLSDDDAMAVMSNPAVLQKYLAPRDPTGSRTEYGTSVQWGKDGKAYVIGKDGSTKALEADLLPPDELAQARAGGTLTGKTVAQAKADLPRVESNAAKFLANLEMIETDPKFSDMIGPVDTWRPNVTGDARRFQSRIDQTMGESFLEAFGSLKGGGQITEIEGVKATQAITRLGETGMNEKDYRDAIRELKTIVQNGVIRARVQAGLLPPDALSQVIDLEGKGVPSVETQVGIPTAERVTPQNRAGAGQPLGAGASGKSRIIGVE